MSTDVLQKIQRLSPEKQQQFADYLDFLLSRYPDETTDANEVQANVGNGDEAPFFIQALDQQFVPRESLEGLDLKKEYYEERAAKYGF